ncbi:HAD family hydrolase [Chloroflexota bacterium]
MKYRGVLFDLDGTLLDTLQDIADSVNEALSSLGLSGHEVEAYKNFVGDGIDVLAVRALPDNHRDANTVTRLIGCLNENYSKRWAINTVLYHGVANLLDELTIRNIKMAILSNKPHEFTEVMVSTILSRWHFEAVVGNSSSVAKKPDPTAALRITQQLVIDPTEFLYLGDSGVDMKTAIATNMYPVGALWGFRSAEELLSSGAKALIEYPNDLLAFL